MLYFRALTRGLARPAARAAATCAREIEARARARRLARAARGARDGRSRRRAARIEPTDAQRIQRALEVYRVTGKPLSSFHARRGDRRACRSRRSRIALEPSDRAVLHARIAERFHAMLGAGLVEELEALRARYALDARPAVDARGRLPPGVGRARGRRAARRRSRHAASPPRASSPSASSRGCARWTTSNASTACGPTWRRAVARRGVEGFLSRRRGT